MRSLRILLLATLALAAAFASHARGDVGRNGGIVVLPCAVPIQQGGKELRGQYLFALGQPIRAQLPYGMQNSVIAVSLGGTQPHCLGRVQGGEVIITAAELSRLAEAGVQQIELVVVGAEGLALQLRVLVDAERGPTLQVW